jgi:hypothetical protein
VETLTTLRNKLCKSGPNKKPNSDDFVGEWDLCAINADELTKKAMKDVLERAITAVRSKSRTLNF